MTPHHLTLAAEQHKSIKHLTLSQASTSGAFPDKQAATQTRSDRHLESLEGHATNATAGRSSWRTQNPAQSARDMALSCILLTAHNNRAPITTRPRSWGVLCEIHRCVCLSTTAAASAAGAAAAAAQSCSTNWRKPAYPPRPTVLRGRAPTHDTIRTPYTGVGHTQLYTELGMLRLKGGECNTQPALRACVTPAACGRRTGQRDLVHCVGEQLAHNARVVVHESAHHTI